jgi:Pyruvate/2-oxoglutarate dehydrogenase complex, dihydrolipoamide acyltransferase (E2) component, and related enzymes
MFQFLLPDIGEGLEEAEIVEWLVEVGDVVVRDQPLVEVLTDKASSELPSPVAGRVAVLGGVEGQRILVGQLLIEIDDGVTVKQDFEERETSAKAPAETPAATPPSTLGSPPPFAAAAPSSSVSPGTRPKAAPATRKFARDLGVDLTQVPGSGPRRAHFVRGCPEFFYR